jgi:hypothetical protein
MRLTFSPPKKGETDGKTVKRQKVNTLLGRSEDPAVQKLLDKPLESVYNIRKDMTGLQHLYDVYLKGKSGVPFSASHSTFLGIEVANKTVVNISNDIGIEMPVLAGGALRDLIYQRWPKDYDYFINCRDEDEAYETIDKLALRLVDYVEGGENEKYEHANADFENVYAVFNKTYYNLPLQFIVGVWPDLENTYDRFDLSVCQAQMDIVSGDIKLSDEFLNTVRTGRVKKFNDSEYTRHRYDRLLWQLYGARKTLPWQSSGSKLDNTYRYILDLERARAFYDQPQHQPIWPTVP